MMESPYSPGSGIRPAVFVGRESILSRAEVMLARVSNSQKPVQPMVLTGPRGLGKTVTLEEIAEIATGKGFLACGVTFDGISNNTQILAAALAEVITPRFSKKTAHGEAFIRRLAALSVEINAGVVKVTSSAPSDDASRETNARQSLADLLARAASISVEHASGLALFIDEIQEASRADLISICYAVQDVRDVPLIVFMAGLPTTPDVLTAAASFSERFEYRELTRFGSDAAERALIEPSLAVGVAWDVTAVSKVLHQASGSPYMIQKLGDEAWLAASPTSGSTITQSEADIAIERTHRDLRAGMFSGRWAKVTSREKVLIVAIACTCDDTGTARTRDITRLLEASTPQLSRVRKSLIDKGLIESAGVGLLRFTMPAFAQYVLDRTDFPHLGPGYTSLEPQSQIRQALLADEG